MNRTTVIALAFASILALTNATSHADLTFDLRAVSGSQIIIHGPKSVAVSQNSVGGWIDFELYAFVNGYNSTATDESIHSFMGSMLSTHIGRGAVGGSMVNAGEIAPRVRRGIVPPMDHFGSSDGWLQNLDGDPDLEIGGNGQALDVAGFWQRSTNGMVAGRGDPFRVQNYEGQAAVAEFLLYRFSLPIESFLAETPTDTTAISFNNGALAPFGIWFEDGESRSFRNDRISFGESVLIRAAQTPEELALIPEPHTLALALAALLAAAGVAICRRG